MHLPMTLASAALLFALAAISPSEATAQGVGFAKAADQMRASSGQLYHQAKSKKAGSCGTYMFWKKGKCNDARSKT
jgi:hypothetical protein